MALPMRVTSERLGGDGPRMLPKYDYVAEGDTVKVNADSGL